MKRKHFLAQIDEEQIVAAIGRAEAKTTGEIRVLVSHHHCPEPMRMARKHFVRLGMAKTRHRNGVLIFVAPESRTFALVGDSAVHEKCGDAFWELLREEMVKRFKSGEYTEGIVQAIHKAGDLLAEYFPIVPGEGGEDGDGGNELPDAVEVD